MTFSKPSGQVTTQQKPTQKPPKKNTNITGDSEKYRKKRTVEERRANSSGDLAGTRLTPHTIAQLIAPAATASHFHGCVWLARAGKGGSTIEVPFSQLCERPRKLLKSRVLNGRRNPQRRKPHNKQGAQGGLHNVERGPASPYNQPRGSDGVDIIAGCETNSLQSE